MSTDDTKKKNRDKQKRYRDRQKEDGLVEKRVRVPPEKVDTHAKYVRRLGGKA